MLIGKTDFFTKEHIEKHRFHTSPVLAEQVVHCLEMVAELSYLGLDYMFKGGNSLLVLLEEPKRFSIDVDIATGETKERIEEVLDILVKESDLFLRWERRVHKTKPWLPMTSYYLFYKSHFTEPSETSIMLDAQLKMCSYEKVRKPVCCTTLYTSAQTVLLPTPASLIGDKLLTLGPKTLGIPVNKNKEGQRLKHSFDISLLASKSLSLDEMRESIRVCMEQENALQGTSYSLEEVYKDTIELCGCAVKHKNEPENEGLSPYLTEVVKGRKPFEEHIMAENYTWHDLQRDMARSALCLTAVFCPEITSEKLNSVLNKKKEDIVDFKGDFEYLKESNFMASYYWHKITDWLGKNPL